MKKIDIVDYLVDNKRMGRKEAALAVDGVMEAISRSLTKGENVFLRGFGTFRVRQAAERKARDIHKGTFVVVPAHKSVKLVPSPGLIELMNS